MKKKFKKIYIEITNNCNLSCSFCSKVEKKSRFMTVEEFNHIINEVKNETNYIYLHVKGEPLLHPKLDEFLTIADKNNINVNLTTNGTLIKKYIGILANHKCLKKINFSLHCENSIPNYLNNIFESIKQLPQNITIIYRLWTLNNEILDEKSTKIVDKISKHYNLSPNIVEKLKTENNVKISSTIYVDKDNEFEWPNSNQTTKSDGFCQALKTQIAILCDGTVVPCCLDSNGIIDLGNIYNEKLIDIINSDKFQTIKKSFQDRKPICKLCQNCTYKNRFNK